MTSWDWPGARWWKCDLHVHTSGSSDAAEAAPDDVVGAAAQQSLDVLCVTDHNTAAAIAAVRDASACTPDAPIVLPGVELTVASVHLLVLFDADRTAEDIVAFLGACGIPGVDQGKAEAHASCTLPEAMRLAGAHGAISVAAHADHTKGFLTVIPSGQDLMDVVRSEYLCGAEVKDETASCLAYVDNSKAGYRRRFGPLTLIEASDAHRSSDVGSRTTWIKMTRPCVEGLRLALQDGALSVRRGSVATTDPNAHARLTIESIAVSESKLMGRGEAFELRLNPWFNAIIGGRGTGKSTLVEMTRLALDRVDELPPVIRDEFDRLAQVPSARDGMGLLLDGTSIRVVYRKDFDRYSIQWEGGVRSIARQAEDGTWEPSEGDVSQRFPAQVFSQKQVFEIARDPAALLHMVDAAIEEEDVEFAQPLKAARRAYAEARQQVLSCVDDISGESKLKGELEDVSRRIAVHEGAAHSAVRKEFKVRVQQEAALEDFATQLDELSEAIGEFAESLDAPMLDETSFTKDDAVDAQILASAAVSQKECADLLDSLNAAAASSATLRQTFEGAVASLDVYRTRLDAARSAHDELRRVLEEEADGSPDEYDDLISRKGELVDALRDIDARKPELERAGLRLGTAEANILAVRRQMTDTRIGFVEKAVGSSAHIRIEVVPYGSRASAEAKLRAILGRPDGGFDKDVAGILDELYADYGATVPEPGAVEAFEARIAEIQSRMVEISDGNRANHEVRDARFANHLAGLSSDACGELEMWLPDDSLRVAYSPSGDGRDFKPLEQGSPGQKTAALLAFILSYGDSPIILDQPEDDLENRLIYELVVRRIREVKSARQVIAVTHDANIVVNGDAELVAVFDFAGGRTIAPCLGGLQEESVREAICDVLEGGRLAFEERYRRIGEGDE